MDTPLSPQIPPADPTADASALVSLAVDAAGAAVPPVDGAASVAAPDDTAPADDPRAPTAPLIDAAEGTLPMVAGPAASADAAATAEDAGAPPTDAAKGTVPPVAGAAFNAAIPSAEAGALAAPPTDAVGKTVPPVAGAAAGPAANAAPADDAGASGTSFDDTAGKTRVTVTASAAGATASVTAVGANCCGPSDGENVGISMLPVWSHYSKTESEITTVGGERVPLGGYSRRWWRACKGGPPLANDAVVSGGPDTLETGPPLQSISTSRCACPCVVLFASPFTGGPSRQAYLCSQPKLEKGRGPGS